MVKQIVRKLISSVINGFTHLASNAALGSQKIFKNLGISQDVLYKGTDMFFNSLHDSNKQVIPDFKDTVNAFIPTKEPSRYPTTPYDNFMNPISPFELEFKKGHFYQSAMKRMQTKSSSPIVKHAPKKENEFVFNEEGIFRNTGKRLPIDLMLPEIGNRNERRERRTRIVNKNTVVV
jgi:hypothetical protein